MAEEMGQLCNVKCNMVICEIMRIHYFISSICHFLRNLYLKPTTNLLVFYSNEISKSPSREIYTEALIQLSFVITFFMRNCFYILLRRYFFYLLVSFFFSLLASFFSIYFFISFLFVLFFYSILLFYFYIFLFVFMFINFFFNVHIHCFLYFYICKFLFSLIINFFVSI